MYLPPLQPIVNSEIRLDGDVEIHPSASIAPGVILKAAPNSRIVIGPDVCIGMGVILSAYNGSIEIEAGVTLGSGVLIVGSSKIGANACIGTITTIFNMSIAAMTVINPGSIIGDHSRPWQEIPHNQAQHPQTAIAAEAQASTNNQESNSEQNSTPDRELVDEAAAIEEEISTEVSNLEANYNGKKATPQDNLLTNQEVVNASADISDFDPWESEKNSPMGSQFEVGEKTQSTETSPGVAIGKVYIDQLLVTLFPHKNSLNNNPNNSSK